MKYYVDRIVNRITMYRLTLYMLMTLAGVSVLLAVFGIVQFDPFAMVFGALTLVVSSIVANAAFAYMFGVHRNGDSALITAFILFFIFSPPVSIVNGVVLALVAVAAAASKYLLVWRGRHIFNPAAIAAMLVGLVGLQQASWWIGTGPLIFITIIPATLLLYKTRRLRMGLTFISTAILTVLVVSTFKGVEVDAVTSLVVNSWPVVFLAGFMLSEPLTQPPRHYQRLVYALIVGILIGSQITIGMFLVTPEIALVLGNIYGFWCGQRQGLRLKLIGRKQLSRDQVEYIFKPSHPLDYVPGQYLELHTPHAHADSRGERRMFTIAAAPGADTIRIALRHYTPSSTFKKTMQTLPIGTVMTATGIYGDFLLPKKPSDKLLFIAGGIGITPFRAHLEWLLQQNQSRDGVLLYSVRDESDVVFEDILRAKEHGVQLIVVTTPLDQKTLASYVPDIASRHVYISGPPPMVDALDSSARKLGATRIHRDHFNGY